MRDLGTVLLVDDDDGIRTIARLALELGGLTVVERPSGKEALEAVPIVLPDLILLDVMMPELSGLEVLAQLRAQPCSRRIPVVLFTARLGSSEIAQYMALGAAGVISKPFDVEQLPGTLRGLFATHAA